MTKSKSMKLAALLLVLTLITSCFVGGTFAKYITEVSGEDSATIAKWGFDEITITEFSDLFTHGDGAVTVGTIAPGTSGSKTFTITSGAANPEVKYTLKVLAEATDSSVTTATLPENLKWSLLKGTTEEIAETDFDDFLTKFNALEDGTTEYAAGSAPTELNGTYTIKWNWEFNGSDTATNSQDTTDVGTMGGNAVGLKLTITATQLD